LQKDDFPTEIFRVLTLAWSSLQCVVFKPTLAGTDTYRSGVI